MKRTLIVMVAGAALAVLPMPCVAAAQVAGPSRVQLGAGVSVMQFDANNDESSRGVVLRAGLAASWFADAMVVAQYWPDLGYWQGGALVLAGTLYPAGHPRMAPFVEAGLGYFRATDKLGIGFAPIAGVTKIFGVGVEGRVVGPWSLRLDASVRFDPGSMDDEVRLSATYGPRIERPAALPAGSAQASIYALVPLSGPWQPVEPGYGITFATPVSARRDLALDVVLVHWHAADNLLFSGWDTRAVFLLPALALVSAREGPRVQISAGPLATLMVEGPDEGLSAGAHLAASGTTALGGGVVGSLEARLFWMVRSVNLDFSSASQLPGTDERGLLLRVGLGF